VTRMMRTLRPIALALCLFTLTASARPSGAAEPRQGTPRQLANDAASLELKRQQLAEREAALKAKEEALARLSATLDARVNELNAAKQAIEASLIVKKKQDDARYQKMIKIFKGLKPEQAGDLLNKLEGKMVIDLLNQMDQKTAIKLIPFINQPRVLEWTRLSLADK